ncbi:hypothetical protein L3Q82_021763 [Scortum barcoo]|uniref:Uncharacterized protein n=1 Tax=Scortum barcoo TaxID=214431 RepID=A0ACB8X5L7_9TELE|nr:hypothetical protein L3Q82_021763 [Scortum barcoo]
MLCLNRMDFTLEFPRPLMPNVVLVGGINCHVRNPLPEDLESWVSGEHGFIVFTLGSMVSEMPEETTSVFLEAFRQIPQKVIWRYTGQIPGNIPENVKLMHWVPQNDLLAHSGVRAFITHAGSHGLYEGLCHGVPMLMVPLSGDQPDNARKLESRGVGVVLDILSITTKSLLQGINEVINDARLFLACLNTRRLAYETSLALLVLKQGDRRVVDYAIDFRTLAADSVWNMYTINDAFVNGLSEGMKDQLAGIWSGIIHPSSSLAGADDILIFSPDPAVHQRRVHQVLLRLLENQLYAKVEKCKFHASSVSFLNYVISDNHIKMDPEKVHSYLWKEFRHLLGATVSLSSGYHPESNGQTDRELETCLRCLVAQNQTTWSDHLMWIEYAHNALPTAASGLSPFYVVYGYQPPLFQKREEVTITFAHAMARRWRKLSNIAAAAGVKQLTDSQADLQASVATKVNQLTDQMQSLTSRLEGFIAASPSPPAAPAPPASPATAAAAPPQPPPAPFSLPVSSAPVRLTTEVFRRVW